ncbi:outer membrane beta-barrel family protein [Hymenobacter crusticola]|nr:outer membrane beta-barrel family protein [Hymenobacter crusticola]
MRHLLPLLLCLLIQFAAQAQTDQTLRGRIVDAQQQPLEFVTVALVRTTDQQAVQGTLTNAAGEFVLHYATPGAYQLMVRFVGYQPYQSEAFTLASRDWGTLVLTASAAELGEVRVFGKQDLVTAENGNLSVNVAGSTTAAGQTAYDLLRRAPGVAISRDNVVSLNGKQGVRLMLDGKLVYLESADLVALLKTLPANAISNIDLLANPGVQYDAAGTAGLINIRTKKGMAEGLNGAFTVGVSHWYTPKTNADLNLNYRRGRLNLYGTYNHQIGHYAYRYTLYRVQRDTIYDSPTRDTDKRSNVNATLGADYQLDDHQTLGLALSTNQRFGPGLTHTITRISPEATGQLLRTLYATNDYYFQRANRYNASLNYRWQDSTGRTFSAAADYGYFDGGSRNLQPNVYRSPEGTTLSENLYRSLTQAGIDLYAFKADFQDSLGRGQLSVGTKFSDVQSDNNYRFLRVEGAAELLDAQRSNRFEYHEQIAAAYADYQVAVSARVRLQGGLRLENTRARGQLRYADAQTTPTQPVKRDYLNLFPALSAGYKLSDQRRLSLSYARRLDRPAYQSLNPFITLLDELSFWQGNPLLRPQYANRFAVDYSTAGNLALTLAYTRTRDIIASINDTLESNKVAMTPRNVGRQHHLSLTATRSFAPTTWWNISASATLYYVDNQIAFDANRQFRLRALAGNMSLQQSFQLPFWGLNAELVGNYNSPTATSANERNHGNGQLDAALSRKFFKDAGSLSLGITDIFLTSRWNSRSQFAGFYLRSYGYGETRQVRLNFTYNFGNKQVAAPRERKSALDTEAGRIK